MKLFHCKVCGQFTYRRKICLRCSGFGGFVQTFTKEEVTIENIKWFKRGMALIAIVLVPLLFAGTIKYMLDTQDMAGAIVELTEVSSLPSCVGADFTAVRP